jgi:hypothetical protein
MRPGQPESDLVPWRTLTRKPHLPPVVIAYARWFVHVREGRDIREDVPRGWPSVTDPCSRPVDGPDVSVDWRAQAKTHALEHTHNSALDGGENPPKPSSRVPGGGRRFDEEHADARRAGEESRAAALRLRRRPGAAVVAGSALPLGEGQPATRLDYVGPRGPGD